MMGYQRFHCVAHEAVCFRDSTAGIVNEVRLIAVPEFNKPVPVLLAQRRNLIVLNRDGAVASRG